MDTIGQIFKAARNNRGYVVRDIAEQTKIGSRYLLALEDDAYASFPSQTHITGFIRTYAKYLDLDPERMIDIYKRTLLQESPTPIEALTAASKRKAAAMPFVIIVAGIAVILFAFMFITGSDKSREPIATQADNTPDPWVVQNPDRSEQTNTDPGTSALGRTIIRATEQTKIHLVITANGLSTINAVHDNQERNTYFMSNGETIRIEADNSVQITASNPRALLLSLNGVTLEVDTQNQAAAGFVFKWRQSPADGMYHLEYEHLR